MGLRGSGIGGNADFDDKRVHEEVEGKIANYVAGRPIYELCTGAERMEGSSGFLRCWYQEHGLTQVER